MIRALHLFLMTLLTGAQLFTFLWVRRIYLRSSPDIAQLTLRQSLFLDKMAMFFIPLLALSGSLLVHPYGWHYDTPWIVVAYTGLGLIGLLWLLQWRYKWQALHNSRPFALRAYTWLNGGIGFILVFSIKDAIAKNTWF